MGAAASPAPMCASGKELLNDGRSNDCGGNLYRNGVEVAVGTAYFDNADEVQYVCSCKLLLLKTDNTKEVFPNYYIYVGKASLFSCIIDPGILMTAAAASSIATTGSGFEGMTATTA